MYKLNEKLYKSYPELYAENPELISFGKVAQKLKCNTNYLNKIIEKAKIEKTIVYCLPSKKENILLKKSDFNILEKSYNSEYKNDEIPAGYVSKDVFNDAFGFSDSFFSQLCDWCYELKKYVKVFYVNNKKQRLYLLTDESKKIINEKLNKYFNPNRERKNPKQTDTVSKDFNDFRLQKIKTYKHHKIKINKEKMSELFDTNNKYYKVLIDIYKTCSQQNIEDVSLFELHHIIPRFYVRNGNIFPDINKMENLIYLTPNLHFLVHYLEYLCALKTYKKEFLISACVKTATLNEELVDEKYIDEATKCLIKAFYK